MDRSLVLACLLVSTVVLTAHAQGPSDVGVPYNIDVDEHFGTGNGEPTLSVVPFHPVQPVYPQGPNGQPELPYEDPSLNEVDGDAGVPNEPQEPTEEELPSEVEEGQGEGVPAEPEETSEESEPEESLPNEPEEGEGQEDVPSEPEEVPGENESETGEPAEAPQPEEPQPSYEPPNEEKVPQGGEAGAGEEPEAPGTAEEPEEETGSEAEAELPEQPEEGPQEEGEATAEPEQQPKPQPQPEETEPRVIVPESASTEGSAVLPECPPDTQACVGPNGEVCGGHGVCVCGSCACESTHSGRYCQTCPSCPLPCQETSACVRCTAFNDGPLAGPRCDRECRFSVQTVDNVDDSENTCSVLDASDCKISYALDDFFDNFVVKVKQTKECPQVEERRPNLLRRFLFGARNLGRKVWNFVKGGVGGPSVEVNYNAHGRD